ncbi:MAG TPA: Nif11-like leader peptide family natural product precursor [Clostridia bacterium]|nr:Nif11-like leader peptide family natural product precursor [Clostridia bacterium]
MSKENIEKFQEELKKRPELQQKLKETETTEDFIALAKAEGFDFSAEEFTEYARSGKLSDEQLGEVTGGGLYGFDNDLIVTAGYGCTYWTARRTLWLAAKGNCGSCECYDQKGLFGGLCLNKNNSLHDGC